LRLSQYVSEHGVDAFNFEDFLFVGSKLATDPTRLVLVGGQAIETWGHYFDVLAPTGQREPLTEDTDWYGNAEDALWLCRLLGRRNTELYIAKNFDPSPNSAQAYIERPDGRVLMMDFLRAVVGLTHEEIVQYAVPVNVAGVNLSVLHPLYCLESRLANLRGLPSKRNTNGVMQANWAIEIAAAYLEKMPSNGASVRDVMKACRQLADCSEYRAGPYCFEHYQVDPLRAVTPTTLDFVGGQFVTEYWPRRIERISTKRERNRRLVAYRFDLSTARAAKATAIPIRSSVPLTVRAPTTDAGQERDAPSQH